MKKLGGLTLFGVLGSLLLLASGCETASVRELKKENARLTSINMVHAKEAAEMQARLAEAEKQAQLAREDIAGLNEQIRLLQDRLRQKLAGGSKGISSSMQAKLQQIAQAVGGELVGNRILLPGDFLFTSGSWDLKSDAKVTLRDLSGVMAPEKFGLMVMGHTDNEPIKNLKRKGINSNRHLSLMRALSVVEYLESAACNYPASLVYPAGWGELQPVDSNSTKAGKARNRRVEIFIDPDLSGIGAGSAITDVGPAPDGEAVAVPYSGGSEKKSAPSSAKKRSRWEK